MKDLWFHFSLNPEQWAIGDAYVGRRSSGKLFAGISPNTQLKAYQNAIKEALVEANMGELPLLDEGLYDLTFYFWRRRESYQGATRRVVKHAVDTTNMQKALEDALQKVVFDNDRNVREIRSVTVEQSTETQPRILIHAKLWEGFKDSEIPAWVWDMVEKLEDNKPMSSERDYRGATEIF